MRRAERMLKEAEKLKAREFIGPEDVVNAANEKRAKLNMA